jgi:hypothetical protein
VAFVSAEPEAEAGLFRYPPLHPGCAREALDLFAPLGGGYLGHVEASEVWTLTLTSGFGLVRPQRRGQPVGVATRSSWKERRDQPVG